MNTLMKTATATLAASMMAAIGCEESPTEQATATPAAAAPDHAEHDHAAHDHADHGDHDDHDHAAHDHAAHGEGEHAEQTAAAAAAHAKHDMMGEARASDWLAPEEREPYDLDFQMTTQDGQVLALKDLVGKPMAITWIFTRCPMPTMCPAMTSQMARLQGMLQEAGLDEESWLLLVSFDPTFDTPDRLKPYGADRGLEFTNALMLQPDGERFPELLHEFGIDVGYDKDGPVRHAIDLFLVDKQGRFVRYYTGGIWDNQAVLEDLEKLAAE